MNKLKNNPYFLYTLFFALILIIGTLPLEIKSKKVFGFCLFTDEIKQYLPFMKDYIVSIKNAIISGEGLQIYRYNIGLGSDFFLSYTYYSLFDPLTIIAYIIPIKYLEISYYFLTVLRLYLAGIFIIILAKKMGIRNHFALLSTSIFYIFNITVLYTAFRHPMFINGPMLLPITILGAEKIMRNESAFLLILSSFYALISQFYFFIYTSFGFELFVLIRVFLKKESFTKSIFQIIKINLIYILGIFLGGFVLIPQILATLNSSRISSKGFIFYSLKNHAEMLSSFIIPLVGKYYSSGLGNVFVLFIVIAFIFDQKKITWESIYFLITSFLMFISFFGYFINALSYVNNRFSYLINLPAAIILGMVIEAKGKISVTAIKSGYKVILFVIFLICGCLIVYFASTKLLKLSIIIILVMIGTIFLKKFNFGKNLVKIFNYKLLTRITLISSLIVLFTVSIIYIPMTTSEGLSAYTNQQSFSSITNDESFYRVEQNKFILNTDNLSNDNLIYGFNSTYSYNTMSSGEIGNVIEFFNVVNDNTSVGYNGFNSRNALNTINNVKYIIIRESENKEVPYGFKLYDTIKVEKFIPNKFNYSGLGYIEYQNGKRVYENANIYINENYLEFGTFYTKYLHIKEAEKLNYVDRENILLDAVILEEENMDLKQLKLEKINEGFEIDEFEIDNLKINDNHIIVNNGEGKVKFSINNIINCELYLEIVGLRHVDKFKSFSITYRANNYYDKEHYFGYGTNFHIQNNDHLINLGYYDNKSVDLEIIFPKGEYYYDSINYYLNNMEGVESKIANLNKHTLTNLQFNNCGFTGEINVEEDGFLFISIPYSNGFTAYVDGEVVPIHKANIGYMGINIKSGNHIVEFVYKTPGLSLGLKISIISLAITFLLLLLYIKNKKEKDRKDANPISHFEKILK